MLLGGAAVAAAPSVRAMARQRVELQRSPAAGFQYHMGDMIWLQLAEGDELTLVREPDNAYDPRAVRIDWRGHKLGYVPRTENTAVSYLLDGGLEVSAEIVTLRDADDPWQRVEFAVYFRA